jgi:hypothetical protein
MNDNPIQRQSSPSNDPEVSNIAWCRDRSSYHFDVWDNDLRFDTVIGLGKFSGDWSVEVENAIEHSESRCLRDRNIGHRDGFPFVPPAIVKEEYDLLRAGAPADMQWFSYYLNMDGPFQRMVDYFGIGHAQPRINVQMPGQVAPTHIDKLDHQDVNWQELGRADQDNIIRVVIMLTPYQPGHFYQFGNYNLSHWQPGDFFEFAWQHVPHQTANASLYPRASLQITGLRTDKTREFLKWARYQKEIPV